MKKITFGQIVIYNIIDVIILGLINIYTLNSAIIFRLIISLIGIVLLIYPVYPKSLEYRYDEKKCKTIIRGIALAEIILAISMRVNF